MADKRVSTRPARRQAVRFGVVTAALLVVCGVVGCSERRRTLSELKGEYARGNYEETITLCERALRDGIADAEVFRLYGLSLLSLDRDAEAFDRFESAVSMDGALSGEIAARLVAGARDALGRGKAAAAAERLEAAVELDTAVTVGPLEYLAADAFFEDKRWADAARRYEGALAEYPDTSAAEAAYFNLASCYAALGDTTSAIEALEKQLARFPRGTAASRAEWDLVSLLYQRARSEFQRGNYDDAVVLADAVLERTENGVAVQKARFLLGESYERVGDYASACEQYESIVREDQGAGGRYVERARAKIAALREAGVR